MAKRRLAITVLAGLFSGLLVLGFGGRVAMRLVAFTTSAPLRLTVRGVLQVLGAGAAWGAVTAPLLLLLDRLRPRVAGFVGLLFGASVLLLAVVAFAVVQGIGGRIVAPPAFIILSAVLFPALFLGHGLLVEALMVRWSEGRMRPTTSIGDA